MHARIATALVGIPVVVLLTWLGGWPFAAMIAAISVVAQFELYGLRARRLPWLVLGPALSAGAAASLFAMGSEFVALALLLSIATLAAFPLAADIEHALADASSTVLGIAYPPVLLGCLTAVRVGVHPLLDPFWTTMGIIVLVWAADTGAYYAGRTFGRRLLAPAVSPGKTWEGLAGGVAAALVVALLWWAVGDSGLAPWHWLALAVFTGILGPVGDLFESTLKRSAGVKDSAAWLPGHGGFLDRFDALAFVAPPAWLYLVLVVS
jgi:phosphatidate cytidylyltransferase